MIALDVFDFDSSLSILNCHDNSCQFSSRLLCWMNKIVFSWPLHLTSGDEGEQQQRQLSDVEMKWNQRYFL